MRQWVSDHLVSIEEDHVRGEVRIKFRPRLVAGVLAFLTALAILIALRATT